MYLRVHIFSWWSRGALKRGTKALILLSSKWTIQYCFNHILYWCVNYLVFIRVLPWGECKGCWLAVLRKSLVLAQLWDTLSKSSSASASIHTSVHHFIFINRQSMQSIQQDLSCETHRPLLLLSFTLGESNSQLQLLLLLQCCLVSLGGHLVTE